MEIERAVAVVECAKEYLSALILERMDNIARKKGLDSMVITHLGNSYTKDAQYIEVPVLNELEELYREHIHEGGFESPWDQEKGWH